MHVLEIFNQARKSWRPISNVHINIPAAPFATGKKHSYAILFAILTNSFYLQGGMRRAFLVNVNDMPREMWLNGQSQTKYVLKRYVKRNLDRQQLHRIDIQMLTLANKILTDFKADLADCGCTDAQYLE